MALFAFLFTLFGFSLLNAEETNRCSYQSSYIEYYPTPQICECNDAGVATCITDFRTRTAEQSIIALIKKACEWRQVDACAPTDWVWSSSYSVCPECKCTANAPIKWYKDEEEWSVTCYGCSCDDSNKLNCDFFDFWSPSDTTKECPPKTGGFCKDGDDVLKLNTIEIKGAYNSQTMNYDSSATYCASDGTATTGITIDQIKASTIYQNAVRNAPTLKYFIQCCIDEPTKWKFYYSYLQCDCDSNTNTQPIYSKVTPAKLGWDFGSFGSEFEICLECTCSAENTLSSTSSDSGFKPIVCPATFSCKDVYNSGSGRVEKCISAGVDSCIISNQWNLPGKWYSGALAKEVSPGGGCAGVGDDIICSVVGNGKCGAGIYTTTIYRYDCKTKVVAAKEISYTDKHYCCNTADCNDGTNAGVKSAIANCPLNNVITKAEKYKWKELLGNKAVAAKFGPLECAAGDGRGIFDVMFEDFACDSDTMFAYIVPLSRAYCGYLKILAEGQSNQRQQYAEKAFAALMRQFGGLMSESGCILNVKCDITGGKGFSGTITTKKLKITIDLDKKVSNAKAFKKAINSKLGTKEKQLTLKSNEKRRRRLATGASYDITATSKNQEGADAIATKAENMDIGKVTVSSVDSSEKVIDNDSDPNNPGGGGSDGANSNHLRFFNVIFVMILCWILY